MSKEHTSHEYGFFVEVAPKYRKKVTSELSLIKMQKLSISNALREIAAAETNIESHAQKCQDDVEHAFEEMISVLQACKQAMKDEATAYYSSLSGLFDQQKEQLKDIQGKMESAVASVDTTLLDDDQSFLMGLKSTLNKISNLQKKFQIIPLTVDMPQLIAMRAVDVDTLSQYMKTKCSLYELADAKACLIDCSSFIDAKLLVDEQTVLSLTLRDSSGNISVGENKIGVNLLPIQGNRSVKGKLKPLPQGRVKVTLTPEKRGQHQLSVKVNGAHIKNSPFTVTVYMPPSLISQPISMISGLARPEGLTYLQTEDKVLAAIVNEGTVLKVDTQLHSVHSEFIKLFRIAEIAQDTALNVFFATTRENQLHKLSNDGRIIKTIGRLGKRNAEFNRPNGLRVSKNHELYVCDSLNNRIQIFDRDLSFKRSFGKEGTGKGQFNFPSDVDFDSSGNIYVSDHNNYRIQVFTHSERHMRTIIQNIFQPVSLLMHNENIYVTDWHNHKVLVMTKAGEIIATFGGGYLRKPEGITMDNAGFVYVTSDHSKIIMF